MPTHTLQALAQRLQAELIGNGDVEIHRVVHPAKAENVSDLVLLFDPALKSFLNQGRIETALVSTETADVAIPNRLIVKRPKVAMAKLLALFADPVHIAPGIHPTAVIDPSAVIEANVTVGPLCTVGPHSHIGQGTRLVSHVSIGKDVRIGENCLFYPGVFIGDRSEIGSHVILQANAAIGNDGFSYVTAETGSVEAVKATGKIEAQNTEILRIPSMGHVVLEDYVEIGANACVDRATMGETRIGRSTKIDNLVQVAHNVTVGENCMIAALVGLAGSIHVGHRVVIGGQSGFKDHIHVGDDAVIFARSGITQSVPEKTIMIGCHAAPRREFLKQEMRLKRLPSLFESVETLSQKISKIETGTDVLVETTV